MEDPNVEEYSGGELTEYKKKPVTPLIYLLYLVVALLGLFWMIWFWNGSRGPFDPGKWHALEKAAKTTYPFESSPDSR